MELKDKYPLLNYYFPCNETNYDETSKAAHRKQEAEILSVAESITPRCSRYLGSVLHDSWVMSVEQKDNVLKIHLNEFSCHIFCDALVELKGFKVPEKSRICPVILTFKNIKRCSIHGVDQNNKLIPLEKKKYLSRLVMYLYDEILEIRSGLVKLGIMFWTDSPDSWRQYLILELEAEELTIEERQRDAIKELFGEDWLPLFDVFWEEMETRKYFDITTALDFLRSQASAST